MQNKGLTILCGVLIGLNVSAGDFIADFQNALKLYNEGKYADAEKSFAVLYEQGNNAGKDVCLQYAAYSAVKQKKDAEAMNFADKIKDKNLNTFSRMMILKEKNKWDEILVLSKTEDIEKWPDALIYDALMCRGKAFMAKKDNANAEKDFLNSLKYTVSDHNKASAYNTLGTFYKDNLNDKQKAIDAYGEALKFNDAHFTVICKSLIERAKLLVSSGSSEQALKELNGVDMKKKKYYSLAFFQIFFCAGEIYEGQGKKAEALAKYREILELDNLPDATVETARKKIETLK